MSNPIRLPLSPRQAEALSVLLENFPIWGSEFEPMTPDAAQALREIAGKLDALKESR